MKIFRETSLTTRLGILLAVVAIFTFAGAGTYLYHSLSHQLESRDEQELFEKVDEMRHLSQEATSIAAIRLNPHLFVDAMANRDKMMVILKTPDGQMVLENLLGQEELPPMKVVPFGVTPGHDAIVQITTSTGLALSAVAAQANVGNSGEKLIITIARNFSDRVALLSAYRIKVWIAAIFGTLLATGLGYLMVHQGLNSIRIIARQASMITANRLDARLDSASAPRELQDLAEAFNAMLDRLRDSFQRLTQFSADLAHDLRTPLNNLMVQTQVVLSRARTNDDYQNLLISNVEEYERLARMVESMLFLARTENATVAINIVPLDSATELQRIADYFEGVAEDAGVSIIVDAMGLIHADAILLRRAVSNLTANAIRYTPAGGTIHLQAKTNKLDATISVINPGAGINPKHITRLFDRFYRVDTARANSSSSTGLGLAIVQSIMALHAGTANAESQMNGQTIFTLNFPATAMMGNSQLLTDFSQGHSSRASLYQVTKDS